MNSQDCVQVALPQDTPPRPVTTKDIVLPLDIILHMAEYLTFDDFRNFIRSLWPKNDENHVVRAKLWQLSTHRYTIRFINGKELEIEYNFDRSRLTEERILLNVNNLLPVFGGIVSAALDEFTNIPKLCEFVGMHVHLNVCSKRQHTSCPCHRGCIETVDDEAVVGPLVETCKYRHFHHFCSAHVSYWLKNFLHSSIMRREGCWYSAEATFDSIVLFPDNMVCFRDLDRQLHNLLLNPVLKNTM